MPEAARDRKGGSSTPRALQGSLARAPAYPLYILEGEKGEPTDRLALERCLACIREKVLGPGASHGETEETWNLTILSGERVALAEILDAALTLPLFGGQRLVIVRGVSEISAAGDEAGQKVQVEGLRRMVGPEATAVVVLVEPPLDGRLKVHKALRERACVVSCSSPPPQEMPGWLVAEARDKGLELASETSRMLAAIVGTDTSKARQELEKLDLYLGGGGGRRAVTPEDISAVVAGGAIADAWRLCDAVACLDEAEALRIARELIDRGDEAIALIGALAFRLRQMIQAAELHERRVPIPSILGEVRAWGGTRSAIEKHLRRYDPKGVPKGLCELYRADRSCKSGSEPREVLLSAVSRIIRTATGQPRMVPRSL